MQFGIPVHEIGHALGMWHEQQRSDRDDYIRVNWENVNDRYRGQFNKAYTHNLVQYNYGSIMHYSPRVCLHYGPAKLRDSNSNRPSDSIRFESDWPIRKFSNRIGRACQLLVVSLVKRLKPLTALSGTVYRLYE